jgi:cobalt-zinc-cadmium resistance protein CzcA
MLNKIIEFSIKNKLIVGIFTIALFLYGIFEVTKLPIDAVPDITNNQVQVITVAPSFGAVDIERLVTFPIEQASNNIPGLKEIRSFSRFGLSVVTIVFDDETDIYFARQQVAERLQQVQNEIPKGIGTPKLGPVSTGLGEVYQYVVRTEKGYEDKYSITDLRTIQDWIIRRQLLGVKGVAEVSSFGGKLKQYEIAIDPNKLQAFGITVDDVFTALEKNNQNTGGAYIEKGASVLYIRSEGLVKNIADIQNIAVKSLENGTPLFIRNVAEVKFGFATRYGAMTFNGEKEVSGAVVMMLKGANSNEVIQNIKTRVEEIQKILPEGVVIDSFLDRTKMVNNAIGTVESNLLEGALIVIFVLVLFLGNFRAGLLVASVIPLAMLFAIILMNIFHVSGNLMSLGALDFGLIVDGAVIIVEAVMHQLHKKNQLGSNDFSQLEMDNQVKGAAGKMMNSAVFGQIIILIVYLPIFTLQGIEGKMFKPMAQTVGFALLGAFILSLTYIPMMSTLVLSRKKGHKPNISDRMMNRLGESYRARLSKIIQYPKTVIATVLVLFATSIYIMSTLGGEFIPSIEEGDFAVETRVLSGTNLNSSIENINKVAKILKTRFPEVDKVVTKIGSGEVPTDPMPMDCGDMIVSLKDKHEWTSASSFDELAEKMTLAAQEVPGVTTSFQYPVQMRFNELMTGARQDVVCKIYGENLDTLARYAKKLSELVKTVKGTDEIYLEALMGLPQIIIDYNRDAMAQYNINISDVNRVINTAFAGQSSGLIFEDEKRFDLVVRLDSKKRESLEDVQNLLIPTPSGSQVPLYQLAKVELKDGPNQIQREDAKRRVIVGFNVKGRDVESIVTELQQKTNEKLDLPDGYFVQFGGAFENLNAAKERLTIAVPVSLFLIFLLLYFAFKSIKQGLLIYSAIPLSAIGGILLLALRGMPFSISAGVGFIALFGIAVLNGIVLIAEFNRIKESGETSVIQIVLNGTQNRLRPVLMTAFVASLGFLPMALSNGSGAEVQRPLATVVIGGLMIATFLTLFVLPILYILTEKGFKKPKHIEKIVASLIFIGAINFSQAQNISLNAAIDTAVKNNLNLKSEKLKVAYQEALLKSGVNIQPTNVVVEYGQINSIFQDSRINFGQSIRFPSVYSNQKAILNEAWKESQWGQAIQTAELEKQVASTFYDLQVIYAREKLLSKNDSIYAEFLRVSNLRFKTGESNLLEKTSAETQRSQIAMQLKSLQQEKEILQLKFDWLLNAKTSYQPEVNQLKSNLYGGENLQNGEHPRLKLLEQQKSMALRVTKLEKSLFLPDLSVGYNNMSMIGTGANNVTYDRSKRFQSVQVGVGIPLFYGAQKSKVQAAKMNELLSENNFQAGLNQFENEWKTNQIQFLNASENVQNFEQNLLPNAEQISKLANEQFVKGEINYLEWSMLINQVVEIQSQYLNVVQTLNIRSIELNYLLTK